jgi:capsular exopolysaccharide synthesis family protein
MTEGRPDEIRSEGAAQTRGAITDYSANSRSELAPSREDDGYYYGEPFAETDFDLRDSLRVLLKHRWLIGAVTAAFWTLGLLQVLTAKKFYTATLRLQIDRDATKIVESGNVMPLEGVFDIEFYQTQYQLLQSRSLAERVATLSHYSPDLEPSASNADRSSGRVKREQAERLSAAVGAILAGRTVKPVTGSRLVDVSFSDTDPERAQRVANAFGEAFVAANLEKRFQANAYAKSFLEDQLQHLKLRLEEAEKAQLAFAEKEQIVATTDKTSIAESNLAAANAALGGIVAERIKAEQLWRQAQNASGIDLPQILSNRGIEDLRGRRNELATAYQEKAETFGPDYPDMVILKNKIKELDRQLGVEIKTIKNSLKSAFEASLNQENEMKQRVENLRQETLDLQKRSIQYNLLKREVDTTRTLYENLLQRYKEVDVAGGVGANNVFVVDAAERPGAPSAPNLSRTLLLAFALGLAFGLGGAFALEYFDDRIYSPSDAERATGLPLLGVVPLIKNPDELAAQMADQRSSISEAYRSACTSLQFSTAAGLPKSLLITSAGPSEGKSSTAFAVARQFAAIGLKVLLIDADLRRPSLHKQFGLDNGKGLSNFLTRNCEMRDAIRRQDGVNDRIYVLTAGPIPPNPVELLNGSRFASLLTVGGEAFDLVVIDGPPVGAMADALVLANTANAALFVIAGGEGSKSGVRNALKRLAQARARPVGLVLSKFDARKASYGYGYERVYDYEYHLENKRHPDKERGKAALKKLNDDAAVG